MNPAFDPGPRTLVVRCPDWSLTVLGVAPGDPALVLAAGRVAAASEAARAVGVALARLAVVDLSGPTASRQWGAVVAALVGGLDLCWSPPAGRSGPLTPDAWPPGPASGVRC